MKKTLGLLLLIIATSGFTQTNKKVLFIGNSYTSANNLPDLIKSLALAEGNDVDFDTHIPGGAQLSQHASDPTVLSKIVANDWDFVVLQEQSQKPSFPDQQVNTSVYPYAEILVDSIYANNECSLPLFYNTWGRQNGDSQWNGINTFEKMNKRLFDAYTYMSDQAKGMMSPVGIGFAHIKQDGNAVVDFADLYTGDGSHPTIKGSYLAACIFNNVIFSGTSIGNTFLPSGLNNNEAQYLQGVADHVVYDVDSVQIDFKSDLSNNTFTTSINNNEVSFTPIITAGQFESWNFGNGQTSTQENATHIYTAEDTYEVTMFSKENCQLDSVKQNVVISTLGLHKENQQKDFKVYPNPAIDGRIYIDWNGDKAYSVHTVLGKQIYKGKSSQLTLKKGVYFFGYKGKSEKIIVY